MAPFFCSTSALSFFFQARPRVKRDALPPAVVVQDPIDERRAVVAVEPGQGDRQPLAHGLHPGGDPIVAFPPQGLQLDPAGHHVHRAQRVEVEALAAAAAVSDQIDLAEARARVIPVGEGPDGNLLLEPGAGVRRGGAPPGVLGAGGSEQARQGRPAGLPDQLVHGGRDQHFAALHEAIEQFGHEGMQAMRADPPAGLPQDFRRRRDLRPVAPRAPAPHGRGRRSRPPPQQPNGGLAVHPGHGHHLVQEAVFVPPTGLLVPLPLYGGVFSQAGSRHGALLRRLGNRDF